MKIGYYIRTDHGIYKLKNINANKTKWKYECLARDYAQDNDGSYTIVNFSDEMVIKSSQNIIDLIEVGDYVNGKKVLDKKIINTFHKKEDAFYYTALELNDYEILYYTDIVTILTKEQFERMEYKVK